MGNQPLVCAVILALDFDPGLGDCLAALEKSDYGNLDIIVVRNGVFSEEFESKSLAASRKVSEVIFNGFNAGFAAGNNPGLERALAKGASYVFLVNDDTVAPPGLIGLLVQTAGRDPLAGMVGPEVVTGAGAGIISFRGARFDRAACSFELLNAEEPAAPAPSGGAEESDFITGCALLAKREVLEKIGLLDEAYFLYWEDCDWGLRAKAGGYKCLVQRSARIWHRLSASSGGNDSALKIYHKTRSRLLFAEKYAPRARGRLLGGAAKDAAWLIFKSGFPARFRMAAAYLAAALDYCLGRRGPGPAWLGWRKV